LAAEKGLAISSMRPTVGPTPWMFATI
jgi:hypothetical protein